jgi:hypothetical protein
MLALAPVAARAALQGEAEVAYVDYDASAGGKELFSGNSLMQKYNLSWRATNLVQRNQTQYYNFLLGYDIRSFKTQVKDQGESSSFGESFGKLVYTGEVAYAPPHLPLRVSAYSKDTTQAIFRNGLYNGMIGDNLARGMDGQVKVTSSGLTFTYLPEQARSAGMRGMPLLLLDYRELSSKSMTNTLKLDTRLRELAVIGLNKENNWIHYRSHKFDNFQNPLDSFEQQQVQIGLIDFAKRRKWAALTNWINVSADGQLTDKSAANQVDTSEEYDVNFFATARRKTWEGKSFLNFNRYAKHQELTERARIPISLSGIYGANTDWYVRLNSDLGRERKTLGAFYDVTYNNLSLGGTTLKNRSFTVSPALSVSDSENNGNRTTDFQAGVTTASTRRFSRFLDLLASYQYRSRTVANVGTTANNSWDHKISLRSTYRPSTHIMFDLREELHTGSGGAFAEVGNVGGVASLPGYTGPSITAGRGVDAQTYTRSVTTGSLTWNKSAQITNSINVSYDLLTSSERPDDTFYSLDHRFNYYGQKTLAKVETRYWYRTSGVTPAVGLLTHISELQYRPGRVQDGLLRFTYEKQQDGMLVSKTELLQRYNYNFYTSTGVSRVLASLSQEFSIRKQTSYDGLDADITYLALSGRYSPTAKISLFGSTKYEKDRANTSLFYSAGVSADFKLLSATLDYALAERDTDKRREKRLSAIVRRSF